MEEPVRRLVELFTIAVARAVPVPDAFAMTSEVLSARRIGVVALGKAAPAMLDGWLAAFLRAGGDPSRLRGICVAPHGTDYDRYVWPSSIERHSARHPVPDSASEHAARVALEIADALEEADALVALISGGGSSLMTLPVSGMTLESIQQETRHLLASGAPIGQVNARRRALCRVKGGGLAQAAFPARVVSYVLSDVPGDRLCDVASGPTALSADHVEPLAIIGSGAVSLAHAETRARAWGWTVVNLGDGIEGEARDVARAHGELLAEMGKGTNQPLLILSGGETGVTLKGSGQGGRNSEYALALALETERLGLAVYGLAADTDGVDGNGPQAGAWFTPQTLADARGAGLDPASALEVNDTGRFFGAIGQCVRTGLTGTNVNDFRAVLLFPNDGSH